MSNEVPITTEQQLVLQAIYRKFRKGGIWPMVIDLEPVLFGMHSIDVETTVSSLPEGLLFRVSLNQQSRSEDRLLLTIPGMSICKEGTLKDAGSFQWIQYWFGDLFP